ncbi:hypothetical protein [Kordiimonas lacus]|uniref:LTXXQ motif family protein n=1 Tax=Kordiimonas lacus TaxID=637679 RepID=A0A1G7ACZ3_9PROT|nr:hypothetical protein [Kordiimonas lacus]SDE12347.1 hypothetical protein SAMN04488071_2172 [Kordiimonas lacus]
MATIKKLATACILGLTALSVAAPASYAFDHHGDEKKHEKMKDKHKGEHGKMMDDEAMGPEAAEMKKRHHEEWQAMMTRHKESMKGMKDMSKDEKKEMKEAHKAEKKEMKERHKAEWKALKESMGKGDDDDS